MSVLFLSLDLLFSSINLYTQTFLEEVRIKEVLQFDSCILREDNSCCHGGAMALLSLLSSDAGTRVFGRAKYIFLEILFLLHHH